MIRTALSRNGPDVVDVFDHVVRVCEVVGVCRHRQRLERGGPAIHQVAGRRDHRERIDAVHGARIAQQQVHDRVVAVAAADVEHAALEAGVASSMSA